MSIQTIVDNAQSITIDKRKTAAQSVSRSGVVLTAQRANNRPYRFDIQMHNGLKYSDNRGVLEELDKLDITEEETIDIGSTNSGLSYITEYKGGITSGTLTSVGSSGSNLYVNASAVSGSGTLFKKGDFLQPVGNTGGYRYPYQVTSDVAFSTGANVTIPVHRPVISQDGVSLASGNVNKGVDVTFTVKCTQKVDYTIVPHDRIQFDNSFNLVEIITT